MFDKPKQSTEVDVFNSFIGTTANELKESRDLVTVYNNIKNLNVDVCYMITSKAGNLEKTIASYLSDWKKNAHVDCLNKLASKAIGLSCMNKKEYDLLIDTLSLPSSIFSKGSDSDYGKILRDNPELIAVRALQLLRVGK